MLTTMIACMLSLSIVFILPRKQERDAFSKLGTRVLYFGAFYDGPRFLRSTSIGESAYLYRFWHLQIRLEATDVDRSEIIKTLKEFHGLSKLELVTGDPLPQTKIIIDEALTEFRSELPNVEVTKLH